METFKWCVRPDGDISNKPEIYSVDFGDGYNQSAPKGLNNLLREYTVTVKVKNKEALKVDAFLAKHNAVTPFLYNDPYTQTQKKVRCLQWPAKNGLEYTEFTLTLKETL